MLHDQERRDFATMIMANNYRHQEQKLLCSTKAFESLKQHEILRNPISFESKYGK